MDVDWLMLLSRKSTKDALTTKVYRLQKTVVSINVWNLYA